MATQEQAEELFQSFQLPIEYFVLVGDPAGRYSLPAFWHPEIGLRTLIVEKDDLANAFEEFLLQQGVRQFATAREFSEAVESEKWPGWNTCSDAIRWAQIVEQNQRN